mmetsp:Transcript_45866/g.77104  ORF Transcript_45866/g.77104 Transcript_45866/m.77104 type:complete len:172 (+) Transcript_45866:216-731(+)
MNHYMRCFAWFHVGRSEWGYERCNTRMPPGRYVHCSAMDPRANKMYIFGGFHGEYCNALYEYDFVTKCWTYLQVTTAPPPRSGCCCWVHDDHFYIFGGCDDSGYFNDVWKLELNNMPQSLVHIACQYILDTGIQWHDYGLPPNLANHLKMHSHKSTLWRGFPIKHFFDPLD